VLLGAKWRKHMRMECGSVQDGFLYQLMPFFGVILVIFLAYVGTKYISVRYAKMSSGKHIKVLERAALGQDRSLVLVTVNGKAYVLGVTGKSIDVLSTFEENEIAEAADPEKRDFSFFLAESLKRCSFPHIPEFHIRNLNVLNKKNKNGCGKE